MELENHYLATVTVIIESSMDGKLVVEIWMRNRIFTLTQSMFSQDTNYKEKSKFGVGKSEGNHVQQNDQSK